MFFRSSFRAAILGNGERLDVAQALGGTNIVHRPAPVATGPTLYEVIPEPSSTAAEESRAVITLASAVKVHIERALAATRGKIEGRGGAAELLGINPHTLRARMRKLKIEWARFRAP
ncbi:MAG: hypothetical protein JF612_14165 [Planctomycetia bacterium]|nr:hypothetical protein [Planctomycetia bacterium]